MSVSSLRPTRPADWWVACIILLLATVFYTAIIRYAINVPQVDDFLYIDSIRRIFTEGTPFAEQLRLLVEQHNDHRILLSRLIVLGDYWLEDQVNYRTLTLLGSLSVACLLWQVYRLFRQAGVAAWLVLPVALLLFQPSYQEDVWWVLCLLQHTLTLLLMFLVFRLITRPARSAQVGALALGGLVLYSNSNGLFLWIAVVVLLLLSRQWRWSLIWIVTGLVLIGLYFGVNYNFVAKGSLAAVARHPGWVVKSIVSFMGSAVYFDQRRWLLLPGQWLVLGLGAVVLLVIIGSWVRLFLTMNRPISPAIIPLLGIGLVLLGSGVAAALVRSDGSLMIIDRYQLYAVWCLIVLYGLLVMQLTGGARLIVAWLGIGVAAWFWLNAWLYYGPQLADRYNRQVAEGMALKQYRYSVMSQLFGRDPYWQKGWEQAMKQGIYQVPDLPEIRGVETALQASPVLDSTTVFVTESRLLSYLNTDALFLEQTAIPTPNFLYLQSETNRYVLPAQRMPKPIMKPWLADKGVKSFVLPVMLKPGTYRIGWVRYAANGWQATLTQTQLQLPIN
ncbi:hypothetical protein [Fibrivirga algicola]|uniref:Glycosyltransferase RgtA/B/C/D-like domain-containing protein n=1 Tax=Fibrivirga algicola TaxID=2950420 RepID=A0ABX0QEX4_9BACT|nr:hypothetical protein [Fibrivirga algicola]ARK09844.1 hypothetical protein A6C57_05540 [Fibrella sp. ES10-3-2-2]NID10759.1 hypothetical protein [Fibrivirga algicola]